MSQLPDKQEQDGAQDQSSVSVLTNEDKRNLNLSVLSETTSVMNPVEYEQIKKVARDMIKAKAISTKFENVDQVFMALMAGKEMGLGFTESLSDLYFVGGSLNIYGKGTPGALRRNGWRIKYKDETSETCTAVVTNLKTGEEIEDTFTFKEAELSGFVGDKKPGWMPGANRRRKLRYGVLSLIIHTYIPEVLGPVAGIGEYSQDYIEGSATTTHQPAADDSADRQNKMAAAEAKRKNAKNADFRPHAVTNPGGPSEAEIVPPAS